MKDHKENKGEVWYRRIIIAEDDSFQRMYEKIKKNGISMPPQYKVLCSILKDEIGKLSCLGDPIYLVERTGGERDVSVQKTLAELAGVGFKIHVVQETTSSTRVYLTDLSLDVQKVREIVLLSDQFAVYADILEPLSWRGIRIYVCSTALTMDLEDLRSRFKNEFRQEVFSKDHPLISFTDLLVFSDLGLIRG